MFKEQIIAYRIVLISWKPDENNSLPPVSMALCMNIIFIVASGCAFFPKLHIPNAVLLVVNNINIHDTDLVFSGKFCHDVKNQDYDLY